MDFKLTNNKQDIICVLDELENELSFIKDELSEAFKTVAKVKELVLKEN